MDPRYPFTNLVFEGGGVKGIAYAGALGTLDEAGILSGITAVAGTSAGAITAALVAVGYTADELRATMTALDLRSFEDGRLEGPVRLVEHYGWYRGDAFLDWMRSMVGDRMGDPSATFADLADAGRRDLRVVATDLATGRPKVFSAASSPGTAVADAVRRSMSIPFFFAAVRDGDTVYVDGGAVWNYPVEMFDRETPNPATLGFRFENLSSPHPRPVAVHDLVEFTKQLYEAVSTVQTDYYRRSAADRERTVVIDDLGIRATDFALSDEQKQALLERGRTTTRTFLNAWAPPPA